MHTYVYRLSISRNMNGKSGYTENTDRFMGDARLEYMKNVPIAPIVSPFIIGLIY